MTVQAAKLNFSSKNELSLGLPFNISLDGLELLCSCIGLKWLGPMPDVKPCFSLEQLRRRNTEVRKRRATTRKTRSQRCS